MEGTILVRQGNKRRIAAKVKEYFPEHNMYIEPFFGAGGMFFSKEPAQYNIMNDADADVFNLFNVLMNKHEALKELLEIMPHHEALFKFCKDSGSNEYLSDDVWRAARFVYLSNTSFMGDGTTMMYGASNSKKLYIERVDWVHSFLKRLDIKFTSCDFRDMLRRIGFRRNGREKAFIYADPPYLNTGNNYNTPKWKHADAVDLFDMLIDSKIKFAVSEFDNDFIRGIADDKGLNYHIIGERQNLSNRATEILVTNYAIN